MEESLGRQKKAVLALCVVAALVVGAGALLKHFAPGGEGAVVEIIEPSDRTPAAGSDPLPDMPQSEEAPGTGEAASGPQPTQAAPGPSKVVVHVAGVVRSPGVYTLEAGKRVMDAVKAAGGPKPSADLDSINLARKLEDGEQIYVPRKGDAAPPAPASGAASSTGGASASVSRAGTAPSRHAGPSTVNINTAGPQELDRLPGVGPATAQKIIEYRKAAGGFGRPEDLLNVKGIGDKKFAEMKPWVVVR